MTLMILAAVALFIGAGSGNMWAQDALQLNADANQVLQNFDGMWDADAQAATLDMPQGWRVERQMGAPRTVGSFANAATAVMYTGGTSLARHPLHQRDDLPAQCRQRGHHQADPGL